MSSTLHQNWEQLTLGDLGRVVTGRTPPSSKPELFGDQYPFITPTDMAFSDRSIRPERGISDAGAESLSRIKLPAKTPCFVCIGATIGKLCLTSEESFTNQQINSIVVNKDRHNPDFVYYLLRHVSGQVKSLAGGAATPIINKSAFSEVPVRVPSLEVQGSIASILSTYDDLIENNTRRIEILEEMARRLYEEWFVHFRFPGHEEVSFKESELGEIPEGWNITPIKEAYEGLFDGPHATPKKSDAGPVFLGIKNLREEGGLDLSTIRHISEEEYPKWTKRVTPREGDIVFTYEATLNRYALIPKGFVGCLGRRLALIRPAQVYRHFLYLHFFSESWRNVIAKNTLSGATVDRIPLTTLPDFPVLLPPMQVASDFGQLVGPLFQLTETLAKKNANLRAQRDLLLPKLVSGEIDVSDITMPEDKEVEAA